MEQLVGAVVVPGELGRHQGVFPGGGSCRPRTNSSIPATGYPGELGIGTVVFWGASGWKESAGEVLRRGNRAEASAAREGSIPVRGCLPGLKTVVRVEDGSGRGGAVLSGAGGGFLYPSRGVAAVNAAARCRSGMVATVAER